MPRLSLVATILGLSSISAPAIAGDLHQATDGVTRISAGTPISGQGLRMAVWTSTGPATPERIEVELSAFDDAPVPADATLSLTASKAVRQVWQASEVRFAGSALGAVVPARVTLLDDQARPVGTVELSLNGGGVTCGGHAWYSSFGTVHGHLHLDEDGQVGTIGLVVDGPATARVAAVSVELGGSADGITPMQHRHAPALAAVQQLWTGDLPLEGVAGKRYQVDGVVVDGDGERYGTSYVGDLTVDARPPEVAAYCPWTRPLGITVASLD